MKWPFVSRLRLEFAEQQIADLKQTNAELRELLELEKESRRSDKKQDQQPEESSSKRRMFGTDVMRRATDAAKTKAIQEGRIK